MIEIRPSLGRSLTTLSLEETFPWPSQQATKTPRDGLEIGLLLNKQAAFYLQCTSKYGKHISRPLQFHKRKTQLGVCEHSSEVWERRGTRRRRRKKRGHCKPYQNSSWDMSGGPASIWNWMKSVWCFSLTPGSWLATATITRCQCQCQVPAADQRT